MNREEEQAAINEQINQNIDGHEIPAPETKEQVKETANNSEFDMELLNAETPQREDLVRRIEHTLNKIRPYIQADGGDVEFIDFKDGIVTVSMLGACAGCIMASADISEGIQSILVDEVPEVHHVRMLESTPFGYESLHY